MISSTENMQESFEDEPVVVNTYSIVPQNGRWGKTGIYNIAINGEHDGIYQIRPLYKTLNSNRPYQYEVYLMLEDAELVQTYKRLKDAYLAVHKFMEKNRYVNV